MSIPAGPYYFYLFETGFYIYSIFALLFMDVVRKDFAVMLVHHLLGYCLLVSSYAIRYLLTHETISPYKALPFFLIIPQGCISMGC